ncbi:MAG: class I SAM-dependent methyltransferase [Firmicutes bacterium]|nr:class I SAM-dependent methyltransferase [Bacillota bacterium]
MKRLEAVCSLITPCALFADIGTDHGRVAAFAAKTADRVIASDISEKCLEKARKNTCAGNVEFLVGDGLSVLNCGMDKPVMPDIIALWGMGGPTIADFLMGYKGNAALILQPQTDVPFVRRFLGGIGYKITHDITAFERGKFYDVIRAARGSERLSNIQAQFGRFYRQKDDLLKARLIRLCESLEGYKPTKENIKLLKTAQRALKYQDNAK